MSNVSDAAHIREMDCEELIKLYAALHVDFYSYRNQHSSLSAKSRREVILDKMDLINKQYLQLTGRPINQNQ